MKNRLYIILFLIFLSFCFSTYAQSLPSFLDSIDDESAAAAPISGFIGLGLILGAIYGIKKIDKF